MSFTRKADALIKALNIYAKNHRRWDSNNVIEKIKFISAGNGRSVGEFKVTEDMCNIAGTLHGGFISSAIDYCSVITVAAHPKGIFSWTTDMNVLFLNRSTIGDVVRIETEPIKSTKSRTVMECILKINESNLVLAKAMIGFITPDQVFPVENVLPYDQLMKDE